MNNRPCTKQYINTVGVLHSSSRYYLVSDMSYPPQGSYAQGQPGAGGYPPPQQQPGQSLYPDPAASVASGMESLSIKPRAGTTALLSMFAESNVIGLECKASGKALQISTGDVDGLGDSKDKPAQFIVHVRRPSVVALQSVDQADAWLGIFEGKLVGTARGGPYCEFQVGEIDGKLISLESTMYPGQFVGVLSDGSPKTPGDVDAIAGDDPETPGDVDAIAGDDEKFIPMVVSESSPVVSRATNPQPEQLPPPASQPPPYDPQQQYPQASATAGSYPPPGPGGFAPQGGAYPPQGGAYPPQGGAYPPQGGAYPPQGGAYPPQGVAYQAQPPPPQGPKLPFGFNIMDSFQNGNELQMICRGNGFPLYADKGRIIAKGNLANANTVWTVILPPGAPPGIVMLRSKAWQGIYLSVQKGGVVGVGKGRRFCHLRVRAQPDNYCLFESVEMPGLFVNFFPNGSGGNFKSKGCADSNAQFFIRMVKQCGNFSQQIMTPFGRPSMANNLRTGFIVQLYLKSSSMYLGINKNGIVYNNTKDNDPLTFLEVVDRGMGIVSFNLRNTTALVSHFRLRADGGAVKGKGVSDLNADFRIKELPDGTVCFESVATPGVFIGINVGNGMQTNLNIQLLQIQRTGRTDNVSKIPLN